MNVTTYLISGLLIALAGVVGAYLGKRKYVLPEKKKMAALKDPEQIIAKLEKNTYYVDGKPLDTKPLITALRASKESGISLDDVLPDFALDTPTRIMESPKKSKKDKANQAAPAGTT